MNEEKDLADDPDRLTFVFFSVQAAPFFKPNAGQGGSSEHVQRFSLFIFEWATGEMSKHIHLLR